MEAGGSKPGVTGPGWSGAPLPLRFGFVGMVVLGVIGCAVGLVLGLRAYPPTAAFAVVEVGLPSAVLGGLLGLAFGAAVHLVRQHRASDLP